MKLKQLIPFLLLVGDIKYDAPEYILKKYELMDQTERPYKCLDRDNLKKLLTWIRKWSCPEFTEQDITDIQREFLNRLTNINFINNEGEKSGIPNQRGGRLNRSKDD